MKKTKLLFIIILAFVFAYSFIGFFLLPYLVKEQIVQNSEKVLLRKVSVESVSINPYTFESSLDKLLVQANNGKDIFVEIDKIEVDLDPIYLLWGEINIKLIKISAPFISINIMPDGSFNFSDLLMPTEDNASTTNEVKSELLSIMVEKFSLKGGKINVKDQFYAVDGFTQLNQIDLEINKLSSKTKDWTKNRLMFGINKTGRVVLDSEIKYMPLKLTQNFRLTDLDLTDFQPYVNKQANIDVNSGNLDLNFSVQVNEQTTKLLANLAISEFNLSERRDSKTFFSFSKLLIKDIDFSLNPNQVKIAKANIYEPYARIKIDKNGLSNLDDLVISGKSTDEAEQVKRGEQEAEKPFPILIGTVNFKDGKGEFSDLTLPFPFKTEIHDLNGNIIALGNFAEIKSRVDIDGVVDEYGLAKIDGQLLSSNPKRFTNMEVKFQNIDMTNLSPYAGKFIGRKIKEGKMNVELEYKLDNSQMQGENRIILKKLTLGEKVESKDAVSAPVALAIALLKDRNGVIDLDVPVKGDVDSPDFDIGQVVWTAFNNLIVGVASAPFNFLGKMLGIRAEELENIHFEGGKAKILPPEREKLDKLSTALISKQTLILKVAGTYDQEHDLFAMKTEKLYQEAYAKLEDNTTDLNHMDRDDLDSLIKEIYVAHFGEKRLSASESSVMQKDISPDEKKEILRKEMMLELSEDQKVSQSDLNNLAKERAQNIVSFLVNKGIDSARLTILESAKIENSPEESEYVSSRLSLGTK